MKKCEDMTVEQLRSKLADIVDAEKNPKDNGDITQKEGTVVLNMLDRIKSYEQPWEGHRDILQRIASVFDPDQEILGCACCGEVHAMQREHIFGGIKPAGYSMVLRDLWLLRLNTDQILYHRGKDVVLRRIRSIYPVLDVLQVDSELYFLHPEFVTKADSDEESKIDSIRQVGDDEASLCLRCFNFLKDNQIPKYSIASGCDYGDIRRLPDHAIDYKDLTIAESMAISRSRPYCIIVKVNTSLNSETNKYV